LSNDASADYVERVLTPIGNIPDGAMISLAKALENTKATTVVLGAPALPVVGTQTQK
jgi:hypothetical protein